MNFQKKQMEKSELLKQIEKNYMKVVKKEVEADVADFLNEDM